MNVIQQDLLLSASGYPEAAVMTISQLKNLKQQAQAELNELDKSTRGGEVNTSQRRQIEHQIKYLEQQIAAKKQVSTAGDLNPRPDVWFPSADKTPAEGQALKGAKQQDNVFRHRGNDWLITYKGKEITVKHTKGMSFLAYLLRHPGSNVPCLAVYHQGEPDPDTIGPKWADPTLSSLDKGTNDGPDKTAWEQYGQRLSELDEEIAEAEQNNDLGKIETLKRERKEFLQYVHKSSSPADRQAENVRKNVQKAIKTAIKNIQEFSRELADHLDQNIFTGRECRYSDKIPWIVEN